MVMCLQPPATCSVQLVADVVAERQNGMNAEFFFELLEEWQERVKTYIEEAGSPENVLPWPAIEGKKGSFLNLYSAPAAGSVQGDALKKLRDHKLQLCPACGETGAPNTLDHYLPKKKYPHFCITPYNLFPMCDACQTEKDDKTGDATDPRFFLHPYFHGFVAEQVIRLQIEPPFAEASFTLGVVGGLSPEDERLVELHVRELGIRGRYGRFFRDQHMRLLRQVSRMREKGQDVRETLDTFRHGLEVPSRNAWEHVYYASVLENDPLLDYLCDCELPEHR